MAKNESENQRLLRADEVPEYKVAAKVLEGLALHGYDEDDVCRLLLECFPSILGELRPDKALHHARNAGRFIQENIDDAVLMALTILVQFAVHSASQKTLPIKDGSPERDQVYLPRREDLRRYARDVLDAWIRITEIKTLGGGRPEEWTTETLQKAVLEAAGQVRLSLRTYQSVGKKMTPPQGKDALEKLIKRKGLLSWWQSEVKGRKT